MPEKNKTTTTTHSFSIKRTDLDRLKQFSKETNQSLSSIVQKAINNHFEIYGLRGKELCELKDAAQREGIEIQDLAKKILSKHFSLGYTDLNLFFAPIISWDEVADWPDREGKRAFHPKKRWTAFKEPMTAFGFALQAQEEHWPLFEANTYLFFDHPDSRKIWPGDFILVQDEGRTKLARLCEEKGKYASYLMPLQKQLVVDLPSLEDIIAVHIGNFLF